MVSLSRYITNHPGRLSLAIPSAAGAMNKLTSQRTVMLCDWGVKAGMVCVWMTGKLCDPLANGPYLSTSEMRFFIIWRYRNRPYYLTSAWGRFTVCYSFNAYTNPTIRFASHSTSVISETSNARQNKLGNTAILHELPNSHYYQSISEFLKLLAYTYSIPSELQLLLWYHRTYR